MSNHRPNKPSLACRAEIQNKLGRRWVDGADLETEVELEATCHHRKVRENEITCSRCSSLLRPVCRQVSRCNCPPFCKPPERQPDTS